MAVTVIVFPAGEPFIDGQRGDRLVWSGHAGAVANSDIGWDAVEYGAGVVRVGPVVGPNGKSRVPRRIVHGRVNREQAQRERVAGRQAYDPEGVGDPRP